MSRQDFDFGGVEQYYFPHVDTLEKILVIAPIFLFSVIAHEYAHGWAALKQGDDTAKKLGMLSWNPIKQIDPVTTVLMPLLVGHATNWEVVLGAAKGIPYEPRNFRHYARGEIIVSLAGVTANLAVAIVCALLIPALGLLGGSLASAERTFTIAQVMMMYGVILNAVLIVFNLIPIPPLDGSKVFKYLLPPRLREGYLKLAPFGFFILLALMFWGKGLLSLWMHPAYAAVGMLVSSVRPLMLPDTLGWFQ